MSRSEDGFENDEPPVGNEKQGSPSLNREIPQHAGNPQYSSAAGSGTDSSSKRSFNQTLDSVRNNERVQQAAEASKQYAAYFIGILVRPYQTSRSVNSTHLLNGVITMILTAVLSALFFVIRLSPFHVSFAATFIKPLVLMAITLAAAGVFIVLLLRLSKIQADWIQLAAQFGALLVPAASSLLLADIFALITIYSLSYLLFSFALLFILVAVNVIIFSYPVTKTTIGGLDPLFSIFIVNLVTGYLLYTTLSSTLLSAAKEMLGGFFNW
ncbi:hypothetical protein [Paenibacillus caui]|uniref:hypothetical protein n=1 Tax=Paenibacillus caui TaxID=2873927 RepID=UPI001CA8AB51|nr:hypothetical protein [Paenibacillus caui]